MIFVILNFNNGEPSWRCDRVHVPEVTACTSGTDEAAAPTWEIRNVSARIPETKRCQRRTTSRPANQRDGKDPPFASAPALMSFHPRGCLRGGRSHLCPFWLKIFRRDTSRPFSPFSAEKSPSLSNLQSFCSSFFPLTRRSFVLNTSPRNVHNKSARSPTRREVWLSLGNLRIYSL